MNEEEIFNCPFCGNEPAPYHKGIGCTTYRCPLSGMMFSYKDWNNQSVAKELKQLRQWEQTVRENSPLLNRMENAEKKLESVLELRLCEQRHTILLPDRLYTFTVDPTCKDCNKVLDSLCP